MLTGYVLSPIRLPFLGAVNKGGVWGFVNKKGKEVIELKYNAVSQFVDGYAMVKMGKTFGVIDTCRHALYPKQCHTC